MAVSTAYTPLTYTGTGSAGPFTVTWPFIAATDLVVTVVDSDGAETSKTYPTHFTVTGGSGSNGIPGTGTVTMQSGHEPASGETLRITRSTTKTQSTTLLEGGSFAAKSVEAALDKLLLIAQENSGGGDANDGITGDVMTLNSAGETDYWDGEGHILSDIADPESATDAASRGWVEGYLEDVTTLTYVPFTQSGTGATTRTYISKMRDVYDARDFGINSASSDNTAVVQAAIDAIKPASGASYGGGRLMFPPGNYTFLGTLTVPTSYVQLIGAGSQATTLTFANGSSNCIEVGDAGGTVSRDQVIRDLMIKGSSKTGGAAIQIRNVYNTRFENLQIENVYNGVDCGPACNITTLRNCLIVPNQSGSQYAMKFWAASDGSNRNDVLVIDNCTVTGQWSDAVGILWDGLAHTLEMSNSRFVQLKKGLHIRNTGASSSNYPTFLTALDCQFEGMKDQSARIESGTMMDFIACQFSNLTSGSGGQGNADTHAVEILADAGVSVTRNIKIIGGRASICRQNAIYTAARNVKIAHLTVSSNSMEGSNLHAVVRVAATAVDTTITDLQCAEFGGLAYAANGVQIDNGALGTICDAINARGIYSGGVAVYEPTPAYSTWIGTRVNPDGVAYGPDRAGFGSYNVNRDGGHAGLRRDITTDAIFKIYNNTTGASVGSMLQFQTGTANAAVSYILKDNSAAPYMQEVASSGVATAYRDYDTQVFRTRGATELFRIDSTKMLLALPVGLKSYTVAGLPAATAGYVAFASNGRKNGEGAGVGTGVMVFADGTAWRACDTGATVAA